MKKYSVKPNKKQSKEMKRYWKLLLNEIETHNIKVRELEESMEDQTGIKGIEFFRAYEGDYCGIGNAERTMKLIQSEELEKK
jgi:hypothetical protein